MISALFKTIYSVVDFDWPLLDQKNGVD